jgi:hypothetical protein
MRSKLRIPLASLCALVSLAYGLAASPSYLTLLVSSLASLTMYTYLIHPLWSHPRAKWVVLIVSVPLYLLGIVTLGRLLSYLYLKT